MNKMLSLIMLVLPLWLAGCSTTSSTSAADAYKDLPAHQIFLDGKANLQERKFAEAIKHFEALDVQYPFGTDTERAQLYLIYAYFMKEEYPLSISSADRYIRMHPTSVDVDYAFYMRGVANFNLNLGLLEQILNIDLATRDLTQVKKAYADFNELVVRFPHSRYAAAAHQYMVYLRNILATHEYEVAHYYYDRRAFIAAANRAADVVAHYQGAPVVPAALVLMAKSYQQLGMVKQEEDTVRVLKYNYPEMVIR